MLNIFRPTDTCLRIRRLCNSCELALDLESPVVVELSKYKHQTGLQTTAPISRIYDERDQTKSVTALGRMYTHHDSKY